MKLLGVDKILHVTTENTQTGKSLVPRPGPGEHQHANGVAARSRINRLTCNKRPEPKRPGLFRFGLMILVGSLENERRISWWNH